MNCIIIDDEPMSRKIVQQLVEQTDFLHLKGVFENSVEGEKFIRNHDVDLVLLDIEMPKMSGFELIRSMEKNPLIILISQKQQYAIDAFDYNVVDYVLKPPAYPRFLQACRKAKKIFDSHIAASPGSGFLFVRKDKMYVRIKITDILWAEALGDYVNIFTGNDKITLHSTLKNIEEKLSQDQFVRVHRSYLVQQDKITAVDESVLVIDKKIIPVGESYRKPLMKRLNLL